MQRQAGSRRAGMRGEWWKCMTAVCCAAQMPNRDVPMTSFEDTRVDICLYFIAPHALLPTDIATIKRLGRTVPIVPIISKVPVPAPQDPTLHGVSCGVIRVRVPKQVCRPAAFKLE